MIDPTRLYSALLNTGLQTKDNPLYQVIHDLIGNLAQVSKEVTTINNTISNTNNFITQAIINQSLESSLGSGDDGQDGLPGIQGIQGLQGPRGIPGMDGEDGDDSIFLLR